MVVKIKKIAPYIRVREKIFKTICENACFFPYREGIFIKIL